MGGIVGVTCGAAGGVGDGKEVVGAVPGVAGEAAQGIGALDEPAEAVVGELGGVAVLVGHPEEVAFAVPGVAGGGGGGLPLAVDQCGGAVLRAEDAAPVVVGVAPGQPQGVQAHR